MEGKYLPAFQSHSSYPRAIRHCPPLPDAIELPDPYRLHDSGAAFGEKMHAQFLLFGIDHARHALDAIIDEHFQHRSVKEEVEFYCPTLAEPDSRHLGASDVQPVAFSANQERFVGA